MDNTNERRCVLITGVSKGLGRAAAVLFSRRGWDVAGLARNEVALETLAGELDDGNHFLAPCDVTDEAAVEQFIKGMLNKGGAPDLVLNNAALINENAPLWKVSAEEFDKVIDVNLKGVANVIRHLAPAMIARGTGVFVNFSSGWGRSTSPDVAPYCATKWGIEGLSQALAQDLPHGMASIALNPGIIDTEMLRSTFGAGAEGYRTAESWAETAVPFFEGLSAKDNGAALTAP